MSKKTKWFSVFTIVATVAFVMALVFSLTGVQPLAASATTAGESATGTAVYIIRLTDAPLASYRGGINGLAATNPSARGELRLDPKNADSLAYINYLEGKQAEFRANAESALGRSLTVRFTYQHAFNGLAVELNASEAALVANLPGVAHVQPEFTRYIQTDFGPQWIGANTIWDGSASGVPTQGEGVTIGVIDTGQNLDHPSFAAIGPNDGYVHVNPLGAGSYLGLCLSDPGNWVCNDKLIGYYIFTGETTEDTNGHGSHTASTAGGNVVTATLDISTTNPFNYVAQISGVAPHANIIGYDACMDTSGCPGAALVAAINQTVADGVVDVINYSIGGGTSDPWLDADALAFLAAIDSGIVAADSAGNNGPGASTVGSPADAPWMLASGASTHNRSGSNALLNLTGGSTTPPADMLATGLGTGYGPAPIVYAANYGDALCLNPFTAGTFSGQIVICDRGTNARVAKGWNVLQGGAGGMILANTSAGQSLNSDPHIIPAVHITNVDGDVLKAWLATGSGHMGTIQGTILDFSPSNGDIMAGFSSRGPLVNTASDIIKPDVAAPGVDILAAYRSGSGPVGDAEPWMDEFNVVSGTSMASPHTAGSAALLRALYPNWTPAEIKSALMSTGSTANMLKEDGATPADPFDIGGGRVDLFLAAQTGLVLDITTAEFTAANPALGGNPADLNLASMGNDDCQGTCTWTRTVSSTQAVTTTWTAVANGDAGLGLTVTPSSFTLPPYGTQTITIVADVAGQPSGTWLFGEVNLIGNTAMAHAPAGTATYNGSTVGGPTWNRPSTLGTGQSGSCTLSGVGTATPYTVQSFTVDTDGAYDFDSVQDYDGYIHVYATAFDPNDQCLNQIGLDDDGPGGIGTSQILGVNLVSGTSYYYVTTGYGNTDEGVFTNTISGPGVINLGLAGNLPTNRFPVAVNPGLQPPVIGVEPTAIVNTQYQNVVETVPMTLTNAGQDDLTWTVFEAGGFAPEVDWFDNFDSYATGSQIHGQGGWKGWFNDPNAGALVSSAFAVSAPNSVEIVTTSDLVHEYSGYTTGFWQYTAWQYIPAGFTGESYFIMLNQYDDAGTNNNWSTQVHFNATQGLVIADGIGAGQTLPLITGQWVEVRMDIDLVNDWQEFYYDGQLLFEGSWTEGNSGGGSLNIGAVDLFANGASAIYYDDISLVETTPALCDVPGDYPWLAAFPGTGVTAGGSNSVVDVTLDATGLATGVYSATLCVTSNDLVTPLVQVPVEMTVTGVPPLIALDPLAFDVTQVVGTQISHTLTISNVGGATLDWTLEEAAPQLPLYVPNYPADAAVNVVTIGDLGLSGSRNTAVHQPTANPAPTNPDDTTITHSATQNITQFNSVSCNAAGLHTDNSYIRRFTLSDFGINDDFTVSSVQVGIEEATGAGGTQPTEVVLYTWDPATAFTFANFTQIAAVNVDVPDQALSIITVPVSAVVPAGSTLVVEFFTPDGQTAGNGLFVGSNADGQTDASFLAAADCGIANPMDTALIGFPDMHIVMNVTGNVAQSVCSTPSDIPWLSVTPTSGSTISGTASLVDVTFDATALSTGVYTGTLCVNSNDPTASLVEVPVSLTVADAYGVMLDGATAASGEPGSMVTYTVYVTNTGTTTDTFDLSVAGAWTPMVSAASVTLAAGEGTMVDVMVHVPAGAANGDMDVTTVTATSQMDPAATASLDLTTTATVTGYTLYLPIIIKP